MNFVVGAPSAPRYEEPADTVADSWPELASVRQQGLSQIELRRAPDGTPVINAAAPVGVNGASLLTTRNAGDITQSVRTARTSLMTIILLALFVSIVLSLYLASTIIEPLRRLVSATERVRLGRERDMEVPRMQPRADEIGQLARAVSDMTATLRHRIDAVETFAADVAHEIKNPLASLRSATESLPRVQDPELRAQLVEVAAHDVRRIDRLVSEISEASRIDAELSRAVFEPVDLCDLFANVVARQARARGDARLRGRGRLSGQPGAGDGGADPAGTGGGEPARQCGVVLAPSRSHYRDGAPDRRAGAGKCLRRGTGHSREFARKGVPPLPFAPPRRREFRQPLRAWALPSRGRLPKRTMERCVWAKGYRRWAGPAWCSNCLRHNMRYRG